MSDRSVPTFIHHACLLAGLLIGATPAVGQQVCRPVLAVTEVRFSAWQPPAMERKWTAIVSVDASRCAAASSGWFAIGFSRFKENGMEVEFSKRFPWAPPVVNVAVDFWADEAVEHFWIDNVSACACAR